MRALRHLLGLVLVLWAAPLWGQGETDRATELFQEGRAALTAGDYDVACTKFEQSLALDVRVGTVLNLGACNEQRGRLATALGHWQEGLRLATEAGDDRQTVAAERALKLEPRVPTLTIEVPSGAAPEVRILSAGQQRSLTAEELGVPLKLDPGKLEIVARWSDGHETRHDVALVAKQRERLVLAPPSADPPEPHAADTDGAPSMAPPTKPADDAGSGLGPVRIAGIVIGAVGVVGLAVAGGLAGAAAKKNGDSNDESNPDLCSKATDECGPTGDALRDDALALANGATGALIAGGVLLGAGVVMIIAAPSEGDDTSAAGHRMQLRVGAASLDLELSW